MCVARSPLTKVRCLLKLEQCSAFCKQVRLIKGVSHDRRVAVSVIECTLCFTLDPSKGMCRWLPQIRLPQF